MRLSKAEEKYLDSLPEGEKKTKRDEFTQSIVKSRHKKQLIVSSAGTGKSSLFIEKVAFWENQGISASKTLVLSFINFIVDSLQNDLGNCKAFTLHKFAKSLIHKYISIGESLKYPLGSDFTVALTNCDEKNIAQDIIWFGKTHPFDPERLKEKIAKYLRCPCSEYLEKGIKETFFKLASFYNCVTFDYSIFIATKILEKTPHILNFKRCLVDEYQDFNPGEQALVSEVFKIIDEGMITGDDDQSLYSQRGADSNGIRNLTTNREWKEEILPFCSRIQSSAIVKSAIILARRQSDTARLDKTYLSLKDNNKKIYIVPLSQSRFSKKHPNNNFLIEAEFISSKLDNKRLKNWKGDDPEYLILGRINRHVNLVAEDLKKKNMEIGTKKNVVFSNQKVQLLYSYLQLLNNNKNNLAYRRLVGLLEDDLDKQNRLVLKALSHGFYSLNDGVMRQIKNQLRKIESTFRKNTDPKKVVNDILKFTKLDSDLNSDLLLKDFVKSVEQQPTLSALLKKTENLAIKEREKEREAILKNPIQCLTIQSSKGLSAKTVFVLGLECGYFPKHQWPTDEEIRLIYVAMTRAREELYFLTCKSRADGVHEAIGSARFEKMRFKKNPSIFIDWLPTKYKEFLRPFTNPFTKADFTDKRLDKVEETIEKSGE